ncbi:uncharacterized protein LOC108735662 [Agrilus planipennis]|uniref:Galactose mutarotase n=1 Tax=Agrilus planipennis TaxID=224129 RepID=A0A1W4WH05_AGRPL|nr:uncharacterized protein LOC108735662 [Agrilus planipennis]
MHKAKKKTKKKKKKQKRKTSMLCYPTITPFPTITHVENGNLILTEDYFDSFYDNCGNRCCIRRFTWKNHNNIQVQLINYGARVVSIKLPSLDGTVQDIVIGYDDLSSYTYYKHHKIGATLGRMCTKIRNEPLLINEIPYSLQLMDRKSYVAEGDPFGFDKTIWKSYVQDSKVIMSYIFQDMEQGYPGNLFVKITFELTPKNEFNVDVEAITDKPTIVNISNNIYFNLCGHGSGPEHLKKHRVFINAKNFFPNGKDGIPTEKAVSVINSVYDFQIPKKIQSLIPSEGSQELNQTFCINQADEGRNEFVASAWHPSSGRMLEVYSNQPGLNFSILGKLVGSKIIDDYLAKSQKSEDEGDTCRLDEQMQVLSHIYHKMVDAKMAEEGVRVNEFKELFEYVCKDMNLSNLPPTPLNTPDFLSYTDFSQPLYMEQKIPTNVTLTPSQEKFLQDVEFYIASTYSETNYETLRETVQNVLNRYYVQQELQHMMEVAGSLSYRQKQEEEEEEEEQEEEEEETEMEQSEEMPPTLLEKEEPPPLGKNEANYKPHGAMCFRTQNHPNEIVKNCLLNPGEIYKHTISYKFWLKASKSKKYWKENMTNDLRPVCKP